MFCFTKKNRILRSGTLVVWNLYSDFSVASHSIIKMQYLSYLVPAFPWKYMKTGFPLLKVLWYHAKSFPCASFHRLAGTVCLEVQNNAATLRTDNWILKKQVMCFPCSLFICMLRKEKKSWTWLKLTKHQGRFLPLMLSTCWWCD